MLTSLPSSSVDEILHLARYFAPQMSGFAKFDRTVVYIYVNGFFGFALYKDTVVSGFSHMRAEGPAAAGIVPEIVDGRFAYNGNSGA